MSPPEGSPVREVSNLLFSATETATEIPSYKTCFSMGMGLVVQELEKGNLSEAEKLIRALVGVHAFIGCLKTIVV